MRDQLHATVPSASLTYQAVIWPSTLPKAKTARPRRRGSDRWRHQRRAATAAGIASLCAFSTNFVLCRFTAQSPFYELPHQSDPAKSVDLKRLKQHLLKWARQNACKLWNFVAKNSDFINAIDKNLASFELGKQYMKSWIGETIGEETRNFAIYASTRKYGFLAYHRVG